MEIEITATYRNIELKLTATDDEMGLIVNKLMDGFNHILCVSNETGEILLDWYVAEDYFVQTVSPFKLFYVFKKIYQIDFKE